MTPFPHQQRVSDKLDEQPGQLVYHGMGSGKTQTAILAAKQHKLPLMAIVPASLRDNFRKEIAGFGFQGPAEVLSYEEAKKLQADPKFLDRASRSLVAIDEAANLGGQSQRAELLQLPAGKKLLLSGTPARNAPEELAPLFRGLGVDMPLGQAFRERYLEERKVRPNWLGRLRGMKPGTEVVGKNLDQFQKSVQGLVDYQPSGTDEFPTSSEEKIEVPMSGPQAEVYREMLRRDPQIAYKIRHNLPPSKEDLRRFQAFSSGPRQVVNDARSFDTAATELDAPKIERAADEVQKALQANPQYRGISYSNYLDSGARPLLAALLKRHVNAGIYSGASSMAARKQMVADYNAGKLPQMIVTGAGSEGLDLKGTRLVQLLEPYWNDARPDQVIGRAVRYRSHADLPEADRNVRVQRFEAVDQEKPGWFRKLLGGKPINHQTVDGYLAGLADRKQKLTQQFLDRLKTAAPSRNFNSP